MDALLEFFRQMNAWRICELVLFLAALVVMTRQEKKDKDRARKLYTAGFLGTILLAVPFACIDVLDAFGVNLFHMPYWPIAPLDILGIMSIVYLSAVSGKKMFGTIKFVED